MWKSSPRPSEATSGEGADKQPGRGWQALGSRWPGISNQEPPPLCMCFGAMRERVRVVFIDKSRHEPGKQMVCGR